VSVWVSIAKPSPTFVSRKAASARLRFPSGSTSPATEQASFLSGSHANRPLQRESCPTGYRQLRASTSSRRRLRPGRGRGQGARTLRCAISRAEPAQRGKEKEDHAAETSDFQEDRICAPIGTSLALKAAMKQVVPARCAIVARLSARLQTPPNQADPTDKPDPPARVVKRGNPLNKAGFGLVERRGRDLNPRRTQRPVTVFETAAFDRSATPPSRDRVPQPRFSAAEPDSLRFRSLRRAGSRRRGLTREPWVHPCCVAEKEGFEPSRQGFPHLTP
jgi:hypothetical protein